MKINGVPFAILAEFDEDSGPMKRAVMVLGITNRKLAKLLHEELYGEYDRFWDNEPDLDDPNVEEPDFDEKSGNFKKQVKWLREKGYTIIPINQVVYDDYYNGTVEVAQIRN